ncbi:MAG: hypothetical protein J5725_02065 [Bacteroidales bacterium]|nr:hypothetical protein [Bacteroidales bacterium]
MEFGSILNRVFTQVSYMLKKKYTTLNCTTKGENIGNAKFPTMYMKELPAVEMANDLDNTTVNAILHTIEIQVYTKNDETMCKNIMNDAVLEMKRFRYNVTAMPIVETSDTVSTGVARFRRMVGSGDTL